MKSSLIPLVIILSCFWGFSSCNRQEEFVNSTEITHTSTKTPYDDVLNDNEVKILLNNNIQPDKIIKVCSPIYFMQLNVEQMSVCQRELMPFDTVIFPVLEDKKITGFIMYQYAEEICCTPRFMPISNEAYNKLKEKHTLKIAMARWKEGGEYYLSYVYFSDDNEAGFLWDFLKDLRAPKPPQIQFEYEELPELQSFDLKSLEVIMTFENE